MKSHRNVLMVLALSSASAALVAATPLTRKAAAALAKKEVPNGTIVSSEREKEEGYDIWSLDVRSSDGKHLYELQYEVSTGKLVSRKEESKEEERKEAAQDKKKAQDQRKKR